MCKMGGGVDVVLMVISALFPDDVIFMISAEVWRFHFLSLTIMPQSRPGNNRKITVGHHVRELLISPGHFWRSWNWVNWKCKIWKQKWPASEYRKGSRPNKRKLSGSALFFCLTLCPVGTYFGRTFGHSCWTLSDVRHLFPSLDYLISRILDP